MIGESYYLLSRERKQEEYISHISELVIDLKKLNALLNSLLELAQINRYNNIQLSGVRIDEIIYIAIQQVKSKYLDRKIIPKIQYPENDNDLLINGNSGLLTIAFRNLIDNACKFSNDDVNIEFIIMDKYIKIIISDKGIGIPSEELNSIYLPFKRASNVKFKGGFGIGLSLVNKIIELHNAALKVHSTENEGTRFEILFKRLNWQSYLIK
jgi:signal transduction histidine kinase